MRVTQRAIRRNYLTSLNRNAKQLTDSTQKMSSGRSFSRISENVSGGSRAFKLRRQIAKNEQYLSNIEDMRNELKVAENGILDVTTILRTVEERMIQGMNGTLSEAERIIIRDEIENLKNNIIQIANSQNIDKFTFGGKNNVTPFTKVGDEWLFEGNPLSENDPDIYELTDRFLDIGFGLNFKEDGSIDEASVAKLSTSGIDVFGFGETEAGMPNNLIVLVEKIANDFKKGNTPEYQKNLEQIQNRRNKLLIQVSDIGNRAKFLEDNENRISSELIDLKSTQIDIEAVSIEEESVYNNSYQLAWQISLKLASSILPQSIFDFMR